ncbi:glycoside hydrolase superfamily [Tuber brumale]|nr:glycoside hydrolase superfamily [Tuber brumale]
MTKYAYSHGRLPSNESVGPVAAEKHKRQHRERDLERGDSRRHHRQGGAGGNGAYDARGHSRPREHRDRKARRSMSQSAPPPPPEKRRRRGPCFCEFWILVGLTILLLIVLIPVGVLVVGKKKSAASHEIQEGLRRGQKGGSISDIDASSIPSAYKETYYDPFTWADAQDFNLTFTDRKVGGLLVLGLWDDYDDSEFPYGTKPIRGVNLGGWRIIEHFITPSFFNKIDPRFGVVDEFTLSKYLGPTNAAKTIERHYASFVNEAAFQEIRDAGLDHVRIPFGYWAVMALEGDSFVPMISWRYLLRAIEYARKYRLRVKLGLHSVPGGANGWNHSGKIGPIETLDIHNQMATFSAQPRYKNVPKMISLDADRVIAWTAKAHGVVRKTGFQGYIIFGDGFRRLDNWKGKSKGLDKMLLAISTTHSAKVKFACDGWGQQMLQSINTSTGFGPTVGVGSRWEGTLNSGDPLTQTTVPSCPVGKGCSCEGANASPSDYSKEYKKFLLMFAEAQMDSFEKSWGWLYWTWDTEAATQWSYKKGLAAGTPPRKAYTRPFNCGDTILDFLSEGLPETY